MPVDFTHQGKSAATRWIDNLPMHHVNPLSGKQPRCAHFIIYSVSRQIILLCLTPDDYTHQGRVLPLVGLRIYRVYQKKVHSWKKFTEVRCARHLQKRSVRLCTLMFSGTSTISDKRFLDSDKIYAYLRLSKYCSA